jgi:hypothetical protein
MGKSFSPILASCLAMGGLAFLPGCSEVGTHQINDGRADYNNAIEQTTMNQTLLNLVRVHEHMPMLFMDISEVDVGLQLQGQLTGTFFSPHALTAGHDRSIGGTLQYQESPTIRYIPLQGQALAEQLSAPISPDAITTLIDSEWPAASVLAFAVNNLTPDPDDYFTAFAAIRALEENNRLLIGTARIVEGQPDATKSVSGQDASTDALVLYYGHKDSTEKDNFGSPLPDDPQDKSMKKGQLKHWLLTKKLDELWPILVNMYKPGGAPRPVIPSQSVGTEYTGAIPITKTTTVRAIAYKDGSESPVGTATYTIDVPPAQPPVAGADKLAPAKIEPPVFSLASGKYSGPQTLVLTSPTPGTKIRFTTEVTDPDYYRIILRTGPQLILGKWIDGTFVPDSKSGKRTDGFGDPKIVPGFKTRSAIGIVRDLTHRELDWDLAIVVNRDEFESKLKPMVESFKSDMERGDPRDFYIFNPHDHKLTGFTNELRRPQYEDADYKSPKVTVDGGSTAADNPWYDPLRAANPSLDDVRSRVDPNGTTLVEGLQELQQDNDILDRSDGFRHYILIVRSESAPPSDAYATARLGDDYYYIDGDDWVSQNNFTLIMDFLAIQSVAQTPQLTPTLSVGAPN